MPLSLVWFKRDLRVHDHAALTLAAERGRVLPLYIWEDEQLTHPEYSSTQLTLTNDALAHLSGDLARLGAPLHVRHGEAASVIAALQAQYGFTAIYAHQETGNAVSYARDRRVRAWARALGLPFHEPPQNGVIRRLRDRDTWADEWEARMGAPPLPAPERLDGPAAPPFVPLRPRAAGLPPLTQTLPWPAGTFGETLARETLHGFLTVRGVNYTREMSSPLSAEHACSRLSPHLMMGTVSLRTVVHATRQRLAAARGDTGTDPRWLRSLRSFESRLHWHCHFMQRLESEPDMEFHALNRALRGLLPTEPDDAARERLRAWTDGRTGYPMIDACMRALHATGWLNFRMRAMLVSFATHHLHLPWRETGLTLARLWLDHEPGIHWAQVQMQSGMVGINRLRVYSPTRQAREQDPDGDFIRRWVPELTDVPTDYVHAPWEWSGTTRTGYPPPIVPETGASRAAHARLNAVRATPEFQAEARRVYDRHGSRKKAALRAERNALGLPPKPPRAARSAGVQRKARMSDQPDLFGLTPEAPTPRAIQPAGLPDSWQHALEDVFAAPAFHRLRDFLVRERREQTIYPPAPDVFSALRLTPLEDVKVLILGQDPYHRPGQAHGLSFSVRPGVPVPPSLRNIYKELQTDLPGFTPPRHGYLRAWAEQGVLLLNAVLTVREGQPNSHANQGWEAVTDAVIRAVNDRPERVVFVLWGAYARKKKALITGPQHVVIESAHPSPLSVANFLGTRPFSRVNAALQQAGRTPIDWQLPMKAEE